MIGDGCTFEHLSGNRGRMALMMLGLTGIDFVDVLRLLSEWFFAEFVCKWSLWSWMMMVRFHLGSVPLDYYLTTLKLKVERPQFLRAIKVLRIYNKQSIAPWINWDRSLNLEWNKLWSQNSDSDSELYCNVE